MAEVPALLRGIDQTLGTPGQETFGSKQISAAKLDEMRAVFRPGGEKQAESTGRVLPVDFRDNLMPNQRFDYDRMTPNQKWDYEHMDRTGRDDYDRMNRDERFNHDHMNRNDQWEYEHMTPSERWDHDHK